jgi:hypothetical protein
MFGKGKLQKSLGIVAEKGSSAFLIIVVLMKAMNAAIIGKAIKPRKTPKPTSSTSVGLGKKRRGTRYTKYRPPGA